jgi:orotidine-5'-phosphate decarboxylase
MKPLIVALDVETEKEAMGLVRATKQFVDVFKIGPGLILRYGPSIIKKIKGTGRKVFLDLKFHDIPTTVARSVKEAGKCGVFSATVHVSAGERALREAAAVRGRPEIWGVTVLTSLSESDLLTLGMNPSPLEQVMRLGGIAKKSGLDGIVASVGETLSLRNVLGKGIKIITPGIRLPDDSKGDQARTSTPQHARISGADFFVVGRPIIESKDPKLVAEVMLKDWHRAPKQ